jgi:hypothetical protein
MNFYFKFLNIHMREKGQLVMITMVIKKQMFDFD